MTIFIHSFQRSYQKMRLATAYPHTGYLTPRQRGRWFLSAPTRGQNANKQNQVSPDQRRFRQGEEEGVGRSRDFNTLCFGGKATILSFYCFMGKLPRGTPVRLAGGWRACRRQPSGAAGRQATAPRGCPPLLPNKDRPLRSRGRSLTSPQALGDGGGLHPGPADLSNTGSGSDFSHRDRIVLLK